MQSILLALQGALSQGLLWAIMALGVYITFRLLNTSDLSVDGSFATGGSVAAILISNNVNPILAILAAIFSGAIAGFITGFLHTKCKIPAILSGILTQLSLYSINLRIMGRSNIPLLKYDNIFKSFSESTGINTMMSTIIIGAIIIVLVIGIMYWFFGTEIGSALRATGSNENMVRSLGVDTNYAKIIGFMIANALVAFSGALVTQSQGYADVKMGTGAIVIGLASIIIGEVLVRKGTNFALKLSAIVFGSIVYRSAVAVVLQLGLNTDDLKLFTAVLVAIALTAPVIVESSDRNKMVKSEEEQ
ncbi:MAG TPA: ABC transporter permease [Erysipelotrichaceae bacterium]|nr:ABC transporter permease [Erysipelotrichaceae bacterium]HCY07150.1 ABC transporter permease [Erysipelotrichaceae bacterium]